MEQSNSCETDPPEIRRRLESIQRQRALIEDLATRLKAAQLEHDRLETELNEYRASIAPIRKCPEEVLLMIFKFFTDGAPELVGLLQVCKRWRDIAANAPRLWTHIKIKIRPTWDQREAARKNAAMVKSHLKHSASLPLHINLDLKYMLDEKSQTNEYADSSGCENELFRYARRFLNPTNAYIDHVVNISESYGPEQVWRMVNVLVGEDGMHMRRWKTLHILQPSNGRDVREIWKLFSGRTPELTELLIPVNLSQLSRASSKKTFPDLSSLEALTLEGVASDTDFLGLTFPSVKRLDLEMIISCSSQLSLFTSLEYLDVLFYGVSAVGAVPAIHLPVLRDLVLHIYGPTGVEWHVPVLQNLTFIGSLDDESKALPNVQAVTVRWGLWLRPPDNPTGLEPELHRTLQTILSKYGDMQELSVHIPMKPIWGKYVQNLSEEKRLVLPPVSFFKY